MSKGKLILLAGLLALIAVTAWSLAPRTSSGDGISLWAATIAWLQQTQSDLWRGLAKAIRATKEEGSLAATAWLVGLSFFYGVVHAAGPGHGKAIISAYLVGNESAVRRGIGLSFLSAAAQGATAILLVSILAAILGFISRDVAGVATGLEIASAWFIVAIGVWLVARTLQQIRRRRQALPHAHHHHAHDHHDACGHGDHHHAHAHAVVTPAQAKGWREGLAIVAAIGARPCMGAIFVLLFALAQGVFTLGILGTAAMSLGTGITVAVLAALASGARATALKVAGSMDGWLDTTYHVLGLIGGLALVLLGLALAFQPPPVFPGAG